MDPMPEAENEMDVGPRKVRRSLEHPSPLVHILAWSLIGLLAYSRHALQLSDEGSPAIVWPEVALWFSCFVPAALFGPVIFRYERRFPLGERPWVRNIAILSVIGIVFAYVACQIATRICVGVEYFFSLPRTFAEPLWLVQKEEWIIQFFLFWAVAGASYVLRNLFRREREKAELLLEKSQLEASLKQAELEALRMRLNPHFLFNTLQNISVLTQQDPRTASQMLTRLGDLLRTAIRCGSEQETDLASEIRLTEAYVAMEKMRFGERLHVAFEIAPETSEATVPTLLLQPLVENAIKHGLNGMSRAGLIDVRTCRQKSQLVLSVTDNGIGPPAGKKEVGIGLGATTTRTPLSGRERTHDAEINGRRDGSPRGAAVQAGPHEDGAL
jgi:two-component sensor histidine kinase